MNAASEDKELLKALEKSEDARIRRWVQANRELNEWLQGKTPLGFLAWLRWMTLIIPFRAASAGASWWQALLVAVALFGIVSAIGPIWKRHKITSLASEVAELESQLSADGGLDAELEQLGLRRKEGPKQLTKPERKKVTHARRASRGPPVKPRKSSLPRKGKRVVESPPMSEAKMLEETLPPEVRRRVSEILGHVLGKPQEQQAQDFQLPTALSFSGFPKPRLEGPVFNAMKPAVDELERILTSSRLLTTRTELSERMGQALTEGDLRLTLGWLLWLTFLEWYDFECGKPPTPEQRAEARRKMAEAGIIHGEAVSDSNVGLWLGGAKLVAREAQTAKDWDALVMVAGFFNCLGLSDVGQEIWKVLITGIGREALIVRAQKLMERRRMAVESFMIRGILELIHKDSESASASP